MVYTNKMGVCPFCGYNGNIKVDKGKPFTLTSWKPGGVVIRVQEIKGGKQPGTGKGYRGSAKPYPPETVETHTLKDLVDKGIYQDYLEQLAEQTKLVARRLIDLGVIDKANI